MKVDFFTIDFKLPLGTRRLFPFSLYFLDVKTKQYSFFLEGNAPLYHEAEVDYLEKVEKGMLPAILLSQRETYRRFFGIKDLIPKIHFGQHISLWLNEDKAHSSTIEQRKKIQNLLLRPPQGNLDCGELISAMSHFLLSQAPPKDIDKSLYTMATSLVRDNFNQDNLLNRGVLFGLLSYLEWKDYRADEKIWGFIILSFMIRSIEGEQQYFSWKHYYNELNFKDIQERHIFKPVDILVNFFNEHKLDQEWIWATKVFPSGPKGFSKEQYFFDFLVDGHFIAAFTLNFIDPSHKKWSLYDKIKMLISNHAGVSLTPRVQRSLSKLLQEKGFAHDEKHLRVS